YSLFQNMIVGGQNAEGQDVTNDLSVMCIVAGKHVQLPQPSLSIRVHNGSPHELLIKAAELTRTGVGLPAYYNDEVIIPSLMSRGLTVEDARNYSIIGCVEPQCPGKTDGWHDAAFFNMCRPLEMVFSRGIDKGEQVGIDTGALSELDTYEKFREAYEKQLQYAIQLLVNADNAIDYAHRERAPLAFESCLVDDCLARGKSLQEGGAVYNFTGPQGFGVANMGDALYAVKTLVYDQKKFTLEELQRALYYNFGNLTEACAASITADVVRAMAAEGKTLTERQIPAALEGVLSSLGERDKKRYAEIKQMIDGVTHFGNDDDAADAFARDAAYMYTRPLATFRNPRGGMFQAGLYPVSANVPLGAQTGATPDGRYAYTPVADGVSPSAGRDVNGPTATANSVSKLDHGIASNGTLFNQKFHPTALSGREGLEKFVALIRAYFDRKGSHMQFNVVSRETLLDAQKHPENYRHLVVRVAAYSALFTT
ncbi:MAG: glycyl radical protein, partial [Clostridiales bacterium]|nr:glycyl radical protein [Clostridiales bacterium]